MNQIDKDQTQRTNIKSSKGKTNNTQGIPIRIRADLSTETHQARREWQDIFKVMKEKNPTAQITIPSKDLIQI